MADANQGGDQDQKVDPSVEKGEVKAAQIPEDSEWNTKAKLTEPEAITEKETEGDSLQADLARVTPKVEEEEKPEPKKDDKAEPEPEVVDDDFEDVEPVAKIEDPGDYTPADYSFEVTVYDEEGKNGKRRIINSVDEWDQLLDEEPNLGSAGSLLKAQRLATKMENSQDSDKKTWETKKEAFDAQEAANKEHWDKVERTANEIQYLVSKGKLPKVDDKYKNADWADPEIAKLPGIKDQIELVNYMNKENKERAKLNLSPMSALEAHTTMQAESLQNENKDAKKAAGKARQAAGAQVAGASSAPNTTVPKGIAVGRGGSLRDLDAGFGF